VGALIGGLIGGRILTWGFNWGLSAREARPGKKACFLEYFGVLSHVGTGKMAFCILGALIGGLNWVQIILLIKTRPNFTSPQLKPPPVGFFK